MEPTTNIQAASATSVIPPSMSANSSPAVCPICHQAVLPAYYFCPNCGAKLNNAPLSASVQAQAWLYIFSAILPIMCFVAVSKWQGIKYYKSSDPQIKKIGTIACTIIAVSTIITIWGAIVWTQQEIQSSVAGINADMSAVGN